jgi:hypothetical protein
LLNSQGLGPSPSVVAFVLITALADAFLRALFNILNIWKVRICSFSPVMVLKTSRTVLQQDPVMATDLYLTDQKKETDETKNQNLGPQGPWQTKAVYLLTKLALKLSIKKKAKDDTSSHRFENGLTTVLEPLRTCLNR